MIISYPRDTLLAAVSFMQRTGAVPKNPTLRVLDYVHLEGGRVTANNLDWALTYAVPIDPHPDFLLPVPALLQVLKRADAKTAITFSFNGDRPPTGIQAVFTIHGRTTSFDFASLPPEDFPPLPTAEWGGPAQVWDLDDLDCFRSALSCSSTDPTRFILNGVFVDVTKCPQAGRFVGTDGRRLYRSGERRWLWLRPVDAEDRGFIIPRVPAFESSGDIFAWPWRLSRSRQLLEICAGPWTLLTKTVTGNYPQYQQVIPKQKRVTGWVLRPGEAKEAAELIACLITDAARKSVTLKLSAAQGPRICGQVGGMQINLPGTVQLPEGINEEYVSLNPDYLCPALNHGAILVTIVDPVSPVVFHLEDGGMEVVMPTRDGPTAPKPAPTPAAIEADAAEEAAEDEEAEAQAAEGEDQETPAPGSDAPVSFPDTSEPLPFTPGTSET